MVTAKITQNRITFISISVQPSIPRRFRTGAAKTLREGNRLQLLPRGNYALLAAVSSSQKRAPRNKTLELYQVIKSLNCDSCM